MCSDGTIQEADLAKDLVVDGKHMDHFTAIVIWETTLDGSDLAATARIRSGWMKFQELLIFLTSRAPHYI